MAASARRRFCVCFLMRVKPQPGIRGQAGQRESFLSRIVVSFLIAAGSALCLLGVGANEARAQTTPTVNVSTTTPTLAENGSATFQVTLTPAQTVPISVRYRIIGGDGVVNPDDPLMGTLTFEANQTTAETVTVRTGTITEDKTLTFRVSSPNFFSDTTVPAATPGEVTIHASPSNLSFAENGGEMRVFVVFPSGVFQAPSDPDNGIPVPSLSRFLFRLHGMASTAERNSDYRMEVESPSGASLSSVSPDGTQWRVVSIPNGSTSATILFTGLGDSAADDNETISFRFPSVANLADDRRGWDPAGEWTVTSDNRLDLTIRENPISIGTAEATAAITDDGATASDGNVFVCRVASASATSCPATPPTDRIRGQGNLYVLAAVNGMAPAGGIKVPLIVGLDPDPNVLLGEVRTLTIDTGERYSDVETFRLPVDIPNNGNVRVGTLTFAGLSGGTPYANQNTHIATLSEYPPVGTPFTFTSTNFLLENARGVGFTLTTGPPISEVQICRAHSTTIGGCGTNNPVEAGNDLRFLARIVPTPTTGDVTVRMVVEDDVTHDFLDTAQQRTLEFTIPRNRAYSDTLTVQTQRVAGQDGNIRLTAESPPMGFDRYLNDGTSASLGISGFNTIPILDTRTISVCRVANTNDSPCPVTPLSNAVEGETVHFRVYLDKEIPSRSFAVYVKLTAEGGDTTKLTGAGDVGVDALTTAFNPASQIRNGTEAWISVPLRDDMVLGGPVTITVDIPSNSYPSGVVVDSAVSEGNVTFIVDDNDTAATAVAPSDFTVDESVGTLTFTVAVSGAPPTTDATVDYAVTGSSGVAFSVVGETGTTGRLSFTAGQTAPQLVRVMITGDSIDEDDGSLTLTLSNAQDILLGNPTTVATIRDDDTPALAIRAVSSSVTEPAHALFAVNASIEPKSELMVALDVTETEISNFLQANRDGAQIFPFPAGQRNATYTVLIENDTTPEPEGSVTVAFGAPPSGQDYTVGMPDSAVVTLMDEEGGIPIVSFADSVLTRSVNESDGTVTLTFDVEIASAPGAQGIVTYAIMGEGITTADYNDLTNGMLTFPSGSAASQAIRLEIVDDTDDEFVETLTITLDTMSDDLATSPTPATVTITDDDVPELTIRANQNSFTESENAHFTVMSNPAPKSDLTVALNVGPSQLGQRYIAEAERGVKILVISAGDATTPFVAILENDQFDDLGDGMAAVTVTIFAPDHSSTPPGQEFTRHVTDFRATANLADDPEDELRTVSLCRVVTDLEMNCDPDALATGNVSAGDDFYIIARVSRAVPAGETFVVPLVTLDSGGSGNERFFTRGQTLTINAGERFSSIPGATFRVPTSVVTSPLRVGVLTETEPRGQYTAWDEGTGYRAVGDVTFTHLGTEEGVGISVDVTAGLPRVSIGRAHSNGMRTGANNALVEGGEVRLIVVVDENSVRPASDLTVTATLEEESGDDFLDAGTQSRVLTFTIPADTGYSNVVTFQTQNDPSGDDGSIRAVITSPGMGAGYALGSNPSSSTQMWDNVFVDVCRVETADSTATDCSMPFTGPVNEGDTVHFLFAVNRSISAIGLVGDVIFTAAGGDTTKLPLNSDGEAVSVHKERVELYDSSFTTFVPRRVVSVTIRDDDTTGNNIPITVTAEIPSNFNASNIGQSAEARDGVTFTVLDSDVALMLPVVSAPADFAVDESAETVTFTITIDEAPDAPATVDYAVTGTADFTVIGEPTGTGTLNFTDASPQIVRVMLDEDDTLDESAETVILTLSNASANITLVGGNMETTVTVTDDDRTITSARGDGSSSTYQIVLNSLPESRTVTATTYQRTTRSTTSGLLAPLPSSYTSPILPRFVATAAADVGISAGPDVEFEICFPLPTRPGTPSIYSGGADGSSWTRTADYVSGGNICTMATTATRTFWAFGALVEPVFTISGFTLNGNPPGNPDPADSRGRIIREDIGSGSTELTLDFAITSFRLFTDITLTVEVRATGGNFIQGHDGGDVRTVEIPVTSGGVYSNNVFTLINDTMDEPDGSIVVTLLNGEGYAPAASDLTYTLNFIDDDEAVATNPEVSAPDAFAVDESAATLTFSVSISEAPTTTPATVAYEITGDADFSVVGGTTTTGGTLNFTDASPQLVRVMLNEEDTTDENDETLTLTLSSPSNLTIADSKAQTVVTVTDNDATRVGTAPAVGVKLDNLPTGRTVTAVSYTLVAPGTDDGRGGAYSNPSIIPSVAALDIISWRVVDVDITPAPTEEFELCFTLPSGTGTPVLYYGGNDGSSWTEVTGSYTRGGDICTRTTSASFWATGRQNTNLPVYSLQGFFRNNMQLTNVAENLGTSMEPGSTDFAMLPIRTGPSLTSPLDLTLEVRATGSDFIRYVPTRVGSVSRDIDGGTTTTITIHAARQNNIYFDHRFSLINDNIDEPDGSLIVTLLDGEGYVLDTVRPLTHTINFVDDDTPQLSIAPDIGHVTQFFTEGTDPRARFTITADIVPKSMLTVLTEVTETSDFVLPEHQGTQTADMLTFTPASGGGVVAVYEVPIDDDGVNDPAGVLTVQLRTIAGQEYDLGSPASASVRIVDDGSSDLVVGISPSASPIYDGDQYGAAEFILTASRIPAENLTVNVNVSETGDFIDAADEGDIQVVIPMGERLVSFRVPVPLDIHMEKEPDGVITARIIDGTGYVSDVSAESAEIEVRDSDRILGVAPNGTVITEPHLPYVFVDITGITVSEGAGHAEIPVRLTAPAPPEGTRVHYWTSFSSPPPPSPLAANLDDYTGFTRGAFRTVSFPGGSREATARIAIKPDTRVEGNESFIVRFDGTGRSLGVRTPMASPENLNLDNDGNIQVFVYIIDDDTTGRPNVYITPRAESVNEGSDIVFDVASDREAGSGGQLSVGYTTSDPYTGGDSTTTPGVLIPAGANAAVLTVPSLRSRDNLNEPDRIVTVSLLTPSDNSYAVSPPASVKILDLDTPTVSIAANGTSSVMEGELVTVDVTVSPVPRSESRTDFSIPLTFTATTDDGGTYTFHEFAPINVYSLTTTPTSTPPLPASYTTPVSFRVGVDNVPGTMDTVTVSIPDPPTGANWEKSATPSETSVVFNVTEGTPATPLVIKAEGVDASEGGGDLTFVITLEARDPAQVVTVGYHTVNPIRQSRNPAHLEALLRDWAAAGEPRALPYRVGRHTVDFTHTAEWVLFDVGETTKTITVPINQDIYAEPDEFVFLHGGGAYGNRLAGRDSRTTNVAIPSGGGAAAQFTASAKILDDDQSVLSVSDVVVDEGDSGTTPMVFTVTLKPASASVVFVDYSVLSGRGGMSREENGVRVVDWQNRVHSVGDAEPDTDYRISDADRFGRLTFRGMDAITLPDNTMISRKTVTVGIIGDEDPEVDETLQFAISSPSGAKLEGDAESLVATGTIRNDDTPAGLNFVIRADSASVQEGSDAVWTVNAKFGGDYVGILNYGRVGARFTQSGPACSPDAAVVEIDPASVTVDESEGTVMLNTSISSDDIGISVTIPPGNGGNSSAQFRVRTGDYDPTMGTCEITAQLLEPTPRYYELGALSSATISVTDNPGTSVPSVVTYAISGDAGAADYADTTSPSGTLNFTLGNPAPQPITLAIVEDKVDEIAETLTVTLASADLTVSESAGDAVVTIRDNDRVVTATDGGSGETPGVVMNNLSESITVTTLESYDPATTAGRPGTYTMPTAPPTAPQTVFTGVFDIDLSSTPTAAFELCFPQPTGMGVPVIYYGGADGSSWTERMSYTSGANVCTETSTASFWAVGSADVPVISVNIPTVFEGQNLVFNVSLDENATAPVSVDYAIRDGLDDGMTNFPTTSADYNTNEDSLTGTLSFNVGESMKTVTIGTVDDSIVENTENLQLVLSNPVPAGSVMIPSEPTQGFIVDNDGPVVSIADVTVDEGDGTLTFPVMLNPASSTLTVTTTYTIEPGTAVVGDYTLPGGLASGVLTFVPNQTRASLLIPIFNDTPDEFDEQFTIRLSNLLPSSGVIFTGGATELVATVTITDDDTPVVAINPVLASVAEGMNAAFAVNASIAPKSDIMVALNVAQPSGSDFLVSGQDGAKSVTIPANTTTLTVEYTVLIDNDEADETDSTLTVTLSANDPSTSSQEYSVGMPSEAVVMLVDDDGTPPVTEAPEVYVCRVETSGASVCPDPAFTAEVMEGDEIHVLAAINGLAAPAGGLTVPLLSADSSSTGGSFANDSVSLTISEGDKVSGSVATFTVSMGAASPVSVGVITTSEDTFFVTPWDASTGYTPVGVSSFSADLGFGASQAVGFSVNVAAPLPTVRICHPLSTDSTMCRPGTDLIAGESVDFIARISAIQTENVTVRMMVADVAHNFLASDTTLEFTIPSGMQHSAPVTLQTQRDADNDGEIGLTAVADAAFEYSPDSFGVTGRLTIPMLAPRTLNLCRVANAGDVTCPTAGTLPNPSEGDDVYFLVTLAPRLDTADVSVQLELTAANDDTTKLPNMMSTYRTVSDVESTITRGDTTRVLTITLLDDDTSGNPVDITVEIVDSLLPTSGVVSIAPAVSGGITFTVDDTDGVVLPEITLCAADSNGTACEPSHAPVIEGGVGNFIVTISPAPTSQVLVDVTVADDADPTKSYLDSSEVRTVTLTVPATITHSNVLTVQTTADTADEMDGEVTLTAANPDDTMFTLADASETLPVLDRRTIEMFCRVADIDAVRCPDSEITSPVNEDTPVHVLVQINRGFGFRAESFDLLLATRVSGDRTKLFDSDTESIGVFFEATDSPTTPAVDDTTTTVVALFFNDDTDNNTGSAEIRIAFDPANNPFNFIPGSVATNGITFMVNDNDALPIVSFDTGQQLHVVDEDTAGTVTLTVDINRNPALSAATVEYTISGDAVATDDYTDATAIPGMLTFPAGSTDTFQTINIAIVPDSVDEATETLTVTLHTPTGVTISAGAAGIARVEITDDDVPALAIRADMASVTEGANAAFTVNASIAPKSDLMVALNVAQPSGSDFLVSGEGGSKPVTLPQGQTSATYTVLIDNDETDETDSTLTVTLSANDPSTSSQEYSVGMPSEAVVMLVDDDGTPPVMEAPEVYVCRVETSGASVCPDPAFTAEVMEGDEIHVLAAINGLAAPAGGLTVPLLSADSSSTGGSFANDSVSLTISEGDKVSGSVATFTVSMGAASPVSVGVITTSEDTFFVTPWDASTGYTPVGVSSFSADLGFGASQAVGFSVNVAAPLPTVRICHPLSTDSTMCRPGTDLIAGEPVDFIARISATQTEDVTVRMMVADVAHNFLASDTTLEFTIPSGMQHSAPVTLQTQRDADNDGEIGLTAVADADAAFEYSSDSFGVPGRLTIPMLAPRTLNLCRVANAGDVTCPTAGTLPNPSEGDDVYFLVTLAPRLDTADVSVQLELTAANDDTTKLPNMMSTYRTVSDVESTITRGDTTRVLTITLLDDDTSGNPVDITVEIVDSLLPTSGVVSIAPAVSGGITFTVDDTDGVAPVVSIDGPDAIMEGEEATFTLTLNPAPTSTLTVSVNVADATSRVSREMGTFLSSGESGVRLVSVSSGEATFNVSTQSDGIYRTTGGSISATVQAGTGYRVTTMPGDDTASVTVNNVDVPVITLEVFGSDGNPLEAVNEGRPFSPQLRSSIPMVSQLPVTLRINEVPKTTDPADLGGRIVGGTGFVLYEGSGVGMTPTDEVITFNPPPPGGVIGTIQFLALSFRTNNLRGAQEGDGYFFAEVICTSDSSNTTNCASSPYTFNEGSNDNQTGNSYEDDSDSEILVRINDINREVSAPANMTVREADAPIVTFAVSITDTGVMPASGTVEYAITGTGTAGTDYDFIGGTVAAGTLNFPAGDTSAQTLSVQIRDEGNIDPNEMLTLTLSSPSNNITIASATTVVSITDNDAPANPPTLAISFDPASVEAGSSTTVTYTLDNPTGGIGYTGINFRHNLLNANFGAPPALVPFRTGSPVTVSNVSGECSGADDGGTVSYSGTPRNNPRPPVDLNGGYLNVSGVGLTSGQSCFFTLSLDIPASLIPEGTQTLTFTNDASTSAVEATEGTFVALADVPQASLTVTAPTSVFLTVENAPSVTEGGPMMFNLRLSEAAASEVTVDYATMDGSAIASSGDYTAITGGRATFTVGATAQTITVMTTEDFDPENTESFELVLTNPTGGIAIAPGSASTLGYILDDDGPVVSVANATANEADGTITFAVSMDKTASADVEVAYTTDNIIAVASEDFTLSPDTLTITMGQTTGTIVATIINDGIDEPNETFALNLTGISGAIGARFADSASSIRAIGTIVDDDDPIEIILPAVRVVQEDAGMVDLSVSLNAAAPQRITVDYSFEDGSAPNSAATSSTDFRVDNLTGVLTFELNDTEQVLRVEIVDDDDDELSENFVLELNNAVNAVFGSGNPSDFISITIEDNDDPAVSFASANLGTVGENAGTPLTFEVNITGAPAEEASVLYEIGGSVDSRDYTVGSGRLVFPALSAASQSFSLDITDDSIDEFNETLTVTLVAPSNLILGSPNAAVATITDDDTPALAISAPDSAIEGTDTMLVFAVNASTPPKENLLVQLDISQTGGPFIATSGQVTPTLVFSGGSTATYTIAIDDDNADEADGSVTVALSKTGAQDYTVGTPANVTVALTDDDVPALSISAGAATIEEGENTVFTVTSSIAPMTNELEVVLNVISVGGSNFVDMYGHRTVTLTFNGGTSATYTLATNNDELDEPDGDLAVTLLRSPSDNYTVGDPATATVTVTDNDETASELTLSGPASIPEDEDAVFTITASPAPTEALTVEFLVLGEEGDFTKGSFLESGEAGRTQQTLTFTGGTATHTVLIDDDGVDELDGSVTLRLSKPVGNSQNYTVVGGTQTATVAIRDNDTPELTLSGPVSITEDMDAVFTITANPVPKRTLWVQLSISQTGSFLEPGQQRGPQPVLGFSTVGDGTAVATYTVAIQDDTINEADGSVTVTLTAISNFGPITGIHGGHGTTQHWQRFLIAG